VTTATRLRDWSALLDAMEGDLAEQAAALAAGRPVSLDDDFDGRFAAERLGPLPRELRERAQVVLARTQALEERLLAATEALASEARMTRRATHVAATRAFSSASTPQFVDHRM